MHVWLMPLLGFWTLGQFSYTHEGYYDTLEVDLLLYLSLYQLRTSRDMAIDFVTLARVYKLMLLRLEEGPHEDPEAVHTINTTN